MTTAIIGTGGLGSVIARQLASGGETLRLSSADRESARTLAAQIGRAAVVAAGTATRCRAPVPLSCATVYRAQGRYRLDRRRAGQVVVVPSNPVSADAHGNVSRVLPEGQSSGRVVAGWLPAGARLAMAFGTMPADLLESSVTGHRSRRSCST